jgi:acetyltransferase-like isoleucine patch superfamily enzyme
VATLTHISVIIGDGAHAQDMLATAEDDRAISLVSHHEDADLVEGSPYAIGINDPRVRDQVRQAIGWDDVWWVHPFTYLGRECRWKAGTHINYGVTMTRTRLGHHCTVSPGVTICGDVTIGNRVLIGAGATICDRVTIGDDVTVGAGAVILPETVIHPGETWVGVPAKRIR